MTLAITVYGVCALTFMMAMYAMESRSRHFIAAFALGCALSSIYGFLAGAWPFGVVEGVWSVVALRRYWPGGRARSQRRQSFERTTKVCIDERRDRCQL